MTLPGIQALAPMMLPLLMEMLIGEFQANSGQAAGLSKLATSGLPAGAFVGDPAAGPGDDFALPGGSGGALDPFGGGGLFAGIPTGVQGGLPTAGNVGGSTPDPGTGLPTLTIDAFNPIPKSAVAAELTPEEENAQRVLAHMMAAVPGGEGRAGFQSRRAAARGGRAQRGARFRSRA